MKDIKLPLQRKRKVIDNFVSASKAGQGNFKVLVMAVRGCVVYSYEE